MQQPHLYIMMFALFLGLLPQSTLATERITRTIEIDGIQREYIAHIPEHTSKEIPLRVVIAFHPALGTSEFMEKTTQLHNTENARRYVVIYPNGYKKRWNAKSCCGTAMKKNINDVGFFHGILTDIKKHAYVEDKAYITGFSNGALFAYHLMCKHPEKVKAVAPFGAAKHTVNCVPDKPIPLFHIHGQKDRSATVEGGQNKYAGYMPSAYDAAKKQAVRNSCTPNLKVETYIRDLDTTCHVWNHDCMDNAQAILCIVPDLGHTWPGVKPGKFFFLNRKFGPARPELNGSQAIMDFFDRY